MKTNRTARNVLLIALWIVLVWTAAEVQGTGMAAPLPVAQQNSQQSQIDQIEKGRATVAQVCVGCHAGIMRMLAVAEKPREEWRDTIHSMIGRGAQVFPDEIEPLTEYLVASAGRGRQEASPAPRAGAGRPGAAATGRGPLEVEANAILEQRCQLCHDIELATTRPASGGWDTVIDRMVTLGASVTFAERQILTEYLTALER